MLKRLFPYSFAFCLLAALTACSSGMVTFSPLPVSANARPTETMWVKHVNQHTALNLTKYMPALDGDTLYLTDIKGTVSAVQLASGNVNWHTRLKAGASAGAAAGQDTVYVPTLDGGLFALSQAQGKVLWHVTLPDQSNTVPTYDHGKLFVKTIDDKLLALDAGTGQILWTYDEGGTQLQLLGSSSAAVSGNTVIAGFSDGKINAVSASNGQLLWQDTVAIPKGFNDVAQMIGVFADPIIEDNRVYAVSYHGTLSAIDLHSGQLIWQQPLSSFDNMALSQSAIFVADTNGNISAYDKRQGKLLWRQTALKGRELSGVALDGDTLVIGDQAGTLHWLSVTQGQFVASAQLGKSALAVQPMVIGNNVLVLSQSGDLFLLRLVK
jgi:outer membrane protein assembly factor BamB